MGLSSGLEGGGGWGRDNRGENQRSYLQFYQEDKQWRMRLLDRQGRDRYRRLAIAIGIADLVKPWHYR